MDKRIAIAWPVQPGTVGANASAPRNAVTTQMKSQAKSATITVKVRWMPTPRRWRRNTATTTSPARMGANEFVAAPSAMAAHTVR